MRNLIKKIIDLIIFLNSLLIKKEKGTTQKLLILRKDGIGDLILFLPTIKYYRELYPEYEITLMLHTICSDFVGRIPEIDKYLIFDQKKYSRDFIYRRKFLLDLKREGFEVIIYPVHSRELSGDLMIKIAKPKESISIMGDDTITSQKSLNKNNSIYTKLISIPEKVESELDKNFYFIKQLGANVTETEAPKIFVDEKDVSAANSLLKENNLLEKDFYIVAPGSGIKFKEWPIENFCEVIDRINLEKTPVIVGGKKDAALAQKIKDTCKRKVIDLTGKTNIFTLAALTKKSYFYFGNDTGPMHIAAATGTPTICIMGLGHFKRFFPYGDLNKNRIIFDENSTCRNDKWRCVKDFEGLDPAPCIKNITTDRALAEIDKMLYHLI